MRTLQSWKLVVALAVLSVASSAAPAAEKDIVDTAVSNGSFKTLAAALQAAGLVDALKGEGPFTVFAPTDEAFAKLPKGTVETLLKPENKQQLTDILTYHVVAGSVPAADVVKLSGASTLNGQRVDIKVAEGKVFVDAAQVVATDVECSNGIIHVIDNVILPATQTIPEVAAKAGDFGTLLAAVKAAGLVDVLSGKGPFTVFAPTDEAFAKLPKATLSSLLKPENKQKLAAILKYHVVSGRVYSPDALKAGKAKTLQGSTVSIGVTGSVARVNDAQLLATDIDASNGVIHVIDTVLLPPAEGAVSSASPRRMIEQAIVHGAPLYNAGHPAMCAKVYMSTVEKLLASEDHGMSSDTIHTMKVALQTAQHSSCSDSQAWTLRNALDLAYSEMSNSAR